MAWPPSTHNDVRQEIDRLRVLTGASFNVKDYGAIGNDVANDTAAFQAAAAAVNAAGGGTLLVPRGAYRVTASTTLGPNIVVEGVGWPTITTSSTTAPIFVYTTPNGTQSPQAPHFRGLRCYGRNIIKLNDPSNGFTDDSTTQYFLMKPAVVDCDFFSDLDGQGIGVQFSKAFDWSVTRSWIGGFSVNLDLHGCDIGTVDNNRFSGGSVAQIRLTSYNTFGTQTNISRNDMLDAKSGCYILSSDFDLRVRDNYIESATHTINAVIRLTGGYAARISGNRVDVSSSIAPNWLDVQVPMALIEVTNNHTTGNEWGPAKFPTGGPLYHYSGGGNQRQRIIHFGNTNSAGLPINSQERVITEPAVAWLWTPDLPGLATGNYGLSARIDGDGALVLPYTGSEFGSLVSFAPGVTGTFTIEILAKGAVGGQVLTFQTRNGGTVVATTTHTLTTSFARYTVATATAFTDLNLFTYVGSGTGASIRSIVVRRA